MTLGAHSAGICNPSIIMTQLIHNFNLHVSNMTIISRETSASAEASTSIFQIPTTRHPYLYWSQDLLLHLLYIMILITSIIHNSIHIISPKSDSFDPTEQNIPTQHLIQLTPSTSLSIFKAHGSLNTPFQQSLNSFSPQYQCS